LKGKSRQVPPLLSKMVTVLNMSRSGPPLFIQVELFFIIILGFMRIFSFDSFSHFRFDSFSVFFFSCRSFIFLSFNPVFLFEFLPNWRSHRTPPPKIRGCILRKSQFPIYVNPALVSPAGTSFSPKICFLTRALFIIPFFTSIFGRLFRPFIPTAFQTARRHNYCSAFISPFYSLAFLVVLL